MINYLLRANWLEASLGIVIGEVLAAVTIYFGLV